MSDDRNPYAPIVATFDVRAVAKALGVEVRECLPPADWTSTDVEPAPIELPEGITEFQRFMFGTKG